MQKCVLSKRPYSSRPQKKDEVEKSLDEEDDVNDMENAVQFRTLMKEKGYCFFSRLVKGNSFGSPFVLSK